MFYQLKRHPLPVTAHFEHCLVLTYALPADVLRTLVPPRLELETIHAPGELGMLAIAMVQTRKLRPVGFPACLGQNSFLSGYRVFTRLRTPERILRGLRILRSDTDRRFMQWSGNLLTHYNYRHAAVRAGVRGTKLEFRIRTPHSEADLEVVADVSEASAPLPPGSCFSSIRQAARFAGPLPYTFDYESQTDSLIVIRARRSNWHPRPVTVEVRENTFLSRPPFLGAPSILAGAFYVHNVPYRWERGVRVPGKERVA
jgi:hypothetical protein